MILNLVPRALMWWFSEITVSAARAVVCGLETSLEEQQEQDRKNARSPWSLSNTQLHKEWLLSGIKLWTFVSKYQGKQLAKLQNS